LPEPETLNQEYAEALREKQSAVRQTGSAVKKRAETQWLAKLRRQDYEGPVLDTSRYLQLRGQEIVGNPRQTEEYRKMCQESVDVGEKPDVERYAHLGPLMSSDGWWEEDLDACGYQTHLEPP
jgi:hypothetical protein